MSEKKLHNEECDCGCNHDHDEEFYEDELEIMTLETEEGEREVGIIGVFGIEEQEYIALLSLETEEVMVYRYYEKEDGEFELGSIESDEEYEMVEEVFNTLYVDEDESEEE